MTIRVYAALDRAVDEILFALRPSSAPVRRARASVPPTVCLTFDDGPSFPNTPAILDLLASHGARATFFVVGKCIRGREQLLRRMTGEGHEVGNHTYSHFQPSSLSRAELRADLVRGADAIEAACAQRPKLARPPFGKDRRRFSAVAKACGARTVMWSIDSGDAADESPDTDAVVSAVLDHVESGAIVLLHDGGESPRVATLAGCERIVSSLTSRGFRLVTVSEAICEAHDVPSL